MTAAGHFDGSLELRRWQQLAAGLPLGNLITEKLLHVVQQLGDCADAPRLVIHMRYRGTKQRLTWEKARLVAACTSSAASCAA